MLPFLNIQKWLGSCQESQPANQKGTTVIHRRKTTPKTQICKSQRSAASVNDLRAHLQALGSPDCLELLNITITGKVERRSPHKQPWLLYKALATENPSRGKWRLSLTWKADHCLTGPESPKFRKGQESYFLLNLIFVIQGMMQQIRNSEIS